MMMHVRFESCITFLLLCYLFEYSMVGFFYSFDSFSWQFQRVVIELGGSFGIACIVCTPEFCWHRHNFVLPFGNGLADLIILHTSPATTKSITRSQHHIQDGVFEVFFYSWAFAPSYLLRRLVIHKLRWPVVLCSPKRRSSIQRWYHRKPFPM